MILSTRGQVSSSPGVGGWYGSDFGSHCLVIGLRVHTEGALSLPGRTCILGTSELRVLILALITQAGVGRGAGSILLNRIH